MSAIIGVHVDQENLDLSKTIEELGIDDYAPALTSEEKQATVGDLIKARSGIYHVALGESPGMKAMRPKRHSHPPGTFWYYNNWDFNALGTIFEQETGTKIFEEFDRRFARPLQMEDFKISNCRYLNSDNYGEFLTSKHRYYLFRVSARDLARFGLLFLREGQWRDRHIVSSAWVRESTASHSEIGPDKGYGYMWWTGTKEGLFPNVKVKDHSYHASGWGGHKIFVWWVKGDKCWLRAKVITGGRKVGINLVLNGNTIKWYDREGTFDGKGVYSRINEEIKVSAD